MTRVPPETTAVQAPTASVPEARAATPRTAPPRRDAPAIAPTLPREATVLRRLPTPEARAEAGPPAADAPPPENPEDVPLSVPAELPEPCTPKGFEQVVFRAASECGMGLDVVALDCSESPCIAWTQAKDDTVTKFSMTGCAPWEEAFQNRTLVVASSQAGEGASRTRYLAWMPIPQDPALQRIAMQRAGGRTGGMKEALGLP